MARLSALPAVLALLLLASACGGSAKPKAATTAAATPTTKPAATATTTATAPPASALQAEAASAATGDIPDNQVFLVFRNGAAGYSMKYPEGWAQSGTGDNVTFRDKNNIVRVVVTKAGPPTASAIAKAVKSLSGTHLAAAPQRLSLPSGQGFKVAYSTSSAPNSVTGKRVTLVVDRYYVAHAGKEAIVDLGTPRGVDNVDAYRLMIESFRWR